MSALELVEIARQSGIEISPERAQEILNERGA